MDTAAYPDGTVEKIVQEHAIPVRLNVFKEREAARSLRAIWTPTVIFLDADGREQHRVFGYHPPREFAAQVLMAAGLGAFAGGRWDDAHASFDRVAREFSDTDPAPEATYWSGVCQFKKTKNTQPIYEACREIVHKFPNHFWAKKIGFVTRYKDFSSI